MKAWGLSLLCSHTPNDVPPEPQWNVSIAAVRGALRPSMKALGRTGMKIYTNELGHMTNMAAMPIYGKNLKKSSSPEPIDRWPWNLVCSIVYASTTKGVQIITLGWPWHILRQGQIWWHRLLCGKKWKSFIFFGNCCSLRSQSCLKHSTQWVNEVEWVSKVKVILWPWLKVTQISKLNVWLLACILRWAIQGLLALLFLFCN